MVRWPTCCVPGCEMPSQSRYEYLERSFGGKVGRRRRRYLCGTHDYAMKKMFNDVFEILTLKHPEVK